MHWFEEPFMVSKTILHDLADFARNYVSLSALKCASSYFSYKSAFDRVIREFWELHDGTESETLYEQYD